MSSMATMRRTDGQSPAGLGLGGRVQRRHLEREAYIYVRQSSLQQVRNNQESTRLQYALAERVEQLGWRAEQIVVIDEDQGQSASSREGRGGFERLFEAVHSGRVGLVMSVDVSRLCRSSYDWQGLVRACMRSGTLVGEQGTLYDPAEPNDRLVLGVKGMFSELELDVFRDRLDKNKRAKAARGALALRPPMGYVCGEDGRLLKDPDERVRSCIEELFVLFERLGSIRKVLKHLRAEGKKLPLRRGALVGWTEPTAGTLRNVLHNPLYSGAYVYGRFKLEAHRRKSGRPYSGIRQLPPEQWEVFLPEQHEPYISLEQFEHNLRRMRQNSPRGLGAPRSGPSLLAGLVHCGRCGQRMQVSYSNNGRGLRYSCIAADLLHGSARCISLLGEPLERAVEQLVLEALEPAALELSVRALDSLQAEQDRLHGQWQQRLEAARYEAQLAERRYRAVDPLNRLVAANLEQEWNEALSALGQLQRRYERFCGERPQQLTEQQRAEIAALASDIPALWHAPSTRPEQRQDLVRLFLERVEVHIEGQSEKLRLLVHWQGGEVQELALRRPVKTLEQLSFYEQMLEQIELLLHQDLNDELIAEQLNALGYTAARGEPLSRSAVGELRRRMGWSRRSRGRTGP